MNSIETKSLLIGGSGQIGSHILRLLGSRRCLLTSRKPGASYGLTLDLATVVTADPVERMVNEHRLDAIYCIAGMTDVEGCEDSPEAAYNTNCRGPAVLARIASQRGIPFVYFSTEYVFDGENGPYREEAKVNPLNVYGKSKWQGELAVLAACNHALILRTTVVYGQDFGKKNYVYSLMRSLASGKIMRVPQDQVSTPTYNLDLAKATIGLVERGAQGIFHVCGPERMDRLEFAKTVALHLGLQGELLVGLPTSALGQRALRPLSAGLSVDKLLRLHPDLRTRSVAEGLSDCRLDLEDFLHAQRLDLF